MHESDVLVFLLSLAVLLSAARLLEELARRLGFPLVFGELASGGLLRRGAWVYSLKAPTPAPSSRPPTESITQRRASLADI